MGPRMTPLPHTAIAWPCRSGGLIWNRTDCDSGTSAAPQSGEQRVEAEATAVMVQREDQHQQQQKEIDPGPLVWRAVEPQPEIEDLQGADDAEQADEQPEHQ